MNKRQAVTKKAVTSSRRVSKKLITSRKVISPITKASLIVPTKAVTNPLINLVEIFPVGISMDPSPGRPVLIFKDKDQKQILPVWLDYIDAGLVLADSSQKTRLSGVHHAVLKIFEEYKLTVDSCVFDEIVGHQQYVTLQMRQEDGLQKSLKLRAAEVMSLCLKARTKFFTTSDVIQKSRDIDMSLMTMSQMSAHGLGIQGVIPDFLKN